MPRALTPEEVYEKGLFGDSSAITLQKTVWWKITKNFGHRARDEARQREFGVIAEGFDDKRKSNYLIWDTKRSTKTRNRALPIGHERDFNPKAWEEPGDQRCPVRIFQCFKSHRPESMQSLKSPMFL